MHIDREDMLELTHSSLLFVLALWLSVYSSKDSFPSVQSRIAVAQLLRMALNGYHDGKVRG